MSNSPLVSIITVAFNSEKTICHTIESVLTQTYDNIEYWIIDGDSRDRTLRSQNPTGCRWRIKASTIIS